MKSVLIYSNSDIVRDPRVNRQVETLKQFYHVILASCGKSIWSDIEFVDLASLNICNKSIREIEIDFRLGHRGEALVWFAYRILCRLPFLFSVREWLEVRLRYRNTIKLLSGLSYDLIIANDIDSLSIVMRCRHMSKILFDAHEYSPEQYSGIVHNHSRDYSFYILRKYLRKCDSMITVSEGISSKYASTFNINKPEVICNAPYYREQAPSMREDKNIRLVHHGVANPLRSIEVMIEIMSYLDPKYTLDFYFINYHSDYCEYLRKLVNGNSRIRICQPVPMIKLAETLNQYDIGLAFFPPLTFNLRHVLPNKFFEFIQGRIAVAIGPSPEMLYYVNKFDLGVVADDFSAESMAEAISSLTRDDLLRYKENANKCAHDLSSEPQMKKLHEIVRSLIEK